MYLRRCIFSLISLVLFANVAGVIAGHAAEDAAQALRAVETCPDLYGQDVSLPGCALVEKIVRTFEYTNFSRSDECRFLALVKSRLAPTIMEVPSACADVPPSCSTAQTFWQVGNLTNARRDFATCLSGLKQDELRPGLLFLAALTELQGSTGDLGLSLIDQAVNESPNSVVLLTLRANVLWHLGRIDDALSDLSLSLRLSPLNTHTLVLACGVNRSVARWRDALASCSKAIDLGDRTTFAFANRGCSYLALSDPRSAIIDLTKAIEANGGWAAPFFLREAAWREMGSDSKADEDAEISCAQFS